MCDLFAQKAKEAAKEYKIPKVYGTMEEMLADEEIEIILNLTRPNEHYKTTKAALLAGKHVYSENRWRQFMRRERSWQPLPGKRGFCLAVRRIPFWVLAFRPAAG